MKGFRDAYVAHLPAPDQTLVDHYRAVKGAVYDQLIESFSKDKQTKEEPE